MTPQNQENNPEIASDYGGSGLRNPEKQLHTLRLVKQLNSESMNTSEKGERNDRHGRSAEPPYRRTAQLNDKTGTHITHLRRRIQCCVVAQPGKESGKTEREQEERQADKWGSVRGLVAA